MEALLMRDWKWWASAALLGGGAVAVACSSSSSSPSDGGAADAEAGVDTGAVSDGTASDGGGDAAMATCEASTMSAATINSGPAWTCLEMVCSASLTACAADCVCNNAVLTALECVVMNGGASATPAQTTACFTSNVGPLISGPEASIVGPVATCLMTMAQGCATQGMEGGTDGGSDGGDSATASDATGDSATASDATSDSKMASDATGE
jgi:hypothetical protein